MSGMSGGQSADVECFVIKDHVSSISWNVSLLSTNSIQDTPDSIVKELYSYRIKLSRMFGTYQFVNNLKQVFKLR